AIDIGGTKNRNDDQSAPWSAWGRTPDGFMKPDIAAPGRYMVGPVPASSPLVAERPTSVTAPGSIQLPGPSLAAPVTSGAADAVSWDAGSWADASWSAVSWAQVSWDAVSWDAVSWDAVSWTDSAYEDAAEGDENNGGGYALTPEQAAEIMADPETAPAPGDLP